MNLGNKILLGAGTTAIVATLAGIITVHQLSSRNRINELHTKMSAVIEQSETMASNMDRMHRDRAFATDELLEEARKASGSRPLTETYAETSIYRTIPIVAAWESVEKAAEKNGYEFFTPSRPGVPARNAKNANGAEFQEVFDAFAAGQSEYFKYDRSKGELTLARPVFMQGSCLSCHGEPSQSPSGNGKDILGFAMEGLKLDDLKGAFILKAPMSGDPVVRATVQLMVLVGVVCLLIVLTGFYFFNRRSIVGPLNRLASSLHLGADRVGDASEQVSAASQTLAEGASEQAAALEQTSASLEEMTSMVKRNADAAVKAKELAADARGAADLGATDMEQMQEAMTAIRSSSDDVAKIVKSIDEIAFQTNILALNAAVEAARAGEAGAGFAVVADEVRNLAQRSAAAARESAGKIESAIEKSHRGVAISEKVSARLEQIVGKVREMDQLAAEIATASNEQAQGLSQVNTAVSEMDKVTQSNAATAEESASASQELFSQASTLNDAVRELQNMIGETKAGQVGARASAGRSPKGETVKPAKKTAPVRSIPVATARPDGRSKGNGSATASLGHSGRSAGGVTSAGSSAIPMEDDFKDF